MPLSNVNAAVIVVNYGSSALLESNLVALSRSDPSTLVVVVDNFTDAAEQSTVATLSAREGWLSVLLPGNVGFGAGMNAGVALALAQNVEAMVLLNPDATLGAADLRDLLEYVASNPLSMASPVIRRSDGSVWSDGSDLYLDDGRIRSSRRRDPASPAPTEFWLSGACLAISRELWERVGGFDERYFLYWEDVDLSHRVVDTGGTLVVLREAAAVHDAGGTQVGERRSDGSRTKSPTYYHYNIRNRILFATLNLPPSHVRAWLANDVVIAGEILLQGGRRQFLRPIAPLTAALRGLRDGRRMGKALLRRARS